MFKSSNSKKQQKKKLNIKVSHYNNSQFITHEDLGEESIGLTNASITAQIEKAVPQSLSENKANAKEIEEHMRIAKSKVEKMRKLRGSVSAKK